MAGHACHNWACNHTALLALLMLAPVAVHCSLWEERREREAKCGTKRRVMLVALWCISLASLPPSSSSLALGSCPLLSFGCTRSNSSEG